MCRCERKKTHTHTWWQKAKFVCITHRNVNRVYLDKHLPSNVFRIAFKNVSALWKYDSGFIQPNNISQLLLIVSTFFYTRRHHKFLAHTQHHSGTQTQQSCHALGAEALEFFCTTIFHLIYSTWEIYINVGFFSCNHPIIWKFHFNFYLIFFSLFSFQVCILRSLWSQFAAKSLYGMVWWRRNVLMLSCTKSKSINVPICTASSFINKYRRGWMHACESFLSEFDYWTQYTQHLILNTDVEYVWSSLQQ